MKKYFGLLLCLFFTYFFSLNASGDDNNISNHAVHGKEVTSKSDIAPLQVSCTEESAVQTNSIDCDNSRFSPDCVKISLSENPVITWKSFDSVRHNVIVLKDGVPLEQRAVGFDVTGEQRENLPSEWSYNFETGEFFGRPEGEFRNIDDNLVSVENSGPGEYNIWCRYHFFSGMVMKLIVVE